MSFEAWDSNLSINIISHVWSWSIIFLSLEYKAQGIWGYSK